MPPPKAPYFTRIERSFRLPLVGFFDQAGAVTFLLSFVLGYRAEVERAWFVPDVTGAGAGASQAIRIRKGNATGTILATITATLANHVMGGPGLDSGAVTAANELASQLSDTDTISITKDAGTVFSAAGGTLHVIFRQKPQARA
jgi:hypothetical protein